MDIMTILKSASNLKELEFHANWLVDADILPDVMALPLEKLHLPRILDKGENVKQNLPVNYTVKNLRLPNVFHNFYLPMISHFRNIENLVIPWLHLDNSVLLHINLEKLRKLHLQCRILYDAEVVIEELLSKLVAVNKLEELILRITNTSSCNWGQIFENVIRMTNLKVLKLMGSCEISYLFVGTELENLQTLVIQANVRRLTYSELNSIILTVSECKKLKELIINIPYAFGMSPSWLNLYERLVKIRENKFPSVFYVEISCPNLSNAFIFNNKWVKLRISSNIGMHFSFVVIEIESHFYFICF